MASEIILWRHRTQTSQGTNMIIIEFVKEFFDKI